MRIAVLVLLLLPSAAALAQAPPPFVAGEPETVYSDAEAARDRSVANRTVNAVLEPVYGVDGQYARWKKPVCFNVYGLTPSAKFVVERRMRQVAGQAGVPLDRRDPCVPNVTIAFTTDTRATLDSIFKANPDLLPDYDFIRMRLKQSQPVQAWYAVSIHGSDGRDELVVDRFGEERPVRISSGEVTRLNTGLSTAIQTVMIVADTNAVTGKTLATMADYFAVLALAQARDTRHCKEVPSIANLMQQDCDPAWQADAATANDLALLTALYRTPDNALQMLQKQRIIGNMRRTMEAQAAGQ